MDQKNQMPNQRELYLPVMPVVTAIISAVIASFLAALAAAVPSALIAILTGILSVTLFAMKSAYIKHRVVYYIIAADAAIAAAITCLCVRSMLPLVVIAALCLGGIAMGHSFRRSGTCRDAVAAAAVTGGLCLLIGIAALWCAGIFFGAVPAPAEFIAQLAESLTAQLASIEVMTEQGLAYVFDENSAAILVRYAFLVSPAFFAISALILCWCAAKLFRLLSRLIGGGCAFSEPWHIEASAADGVMFTAAYFLAFLFSTSPDFELAYYIAGNLAAVYMPFLLLTTVHAASRFLRNRISPGLRILCLLLLLLLIAAGSNLLITTASCFGAYLVIAKKNRQKKKPDREE